ncbi:hypothetical protein [Reichenbachiella sp.]
MKKSRILILIFCLVDIFLIKDLLTNMANTNEMERACRIFDTDVQVLIGEIDLPKEALKYSMYRCDSMLVEIKKCK